MNNFEELYGLSQELFHEINHLIVALSPTGQLFITTQKCGQSYLRSFCKTSHFEITLCNQVAKTNDKKNYLIYKNYYFSPFDEMDISHEEMFNELGVSNITELLNKKCKIIIRHPFDRFISALFFLGKVQVMDRLKKSYYNGYPPDAEIDKISTNQVKNWIDEYWQDVLINQSKFEFSDPHLRPWLSFVENIKGDNSEIILLSELSKNTEEDLKISNVLRGRDVIEYNATKKYYKDRNLDTQTSPYRKMLLLYKEIFINEYQSWINLTNGREENS